MITLKYIPFTYQWILKRAIGKNVSTMIDLGCGDGFLMKILSFKESWEITGVELYKDALRVAKKRGAYECLVNCSITNLKREIRNKKYDVVFCSQVIEHLERKAVLKNLRIWEKMAGKRIIITTTYGLFPYAPIENKRKEENPFQKHHSGWKPDFFEKRGYSVRGQGIKFIYGQKGIARLIPSLMPLWFLVGYMFAPLTYFFPELGNYMICWKDV